MDDRCLLFFVKNPERGTVKTRLASSVGEEVARDLYKNFILDMLAALEKRDFALSICFYPEDALKDLKKMLGGKYRYLPQKGEDLGRRMEHGLHQAFCWGFHRVVIIGSDLPDLPMEIVVQAFNFLEGVDSVIGPTFDGGYYLIGFHRGGFLPETFRGIQWGTGTVLKQTMDILRGHKLTTHLLPSWRDIDTFEDLKQFFDNNKDTSNCPRTMAYLRTAKLSVTES